MSGLSVSWWSRVILFSPDENTRSLRGSVLSGGLTRRGLATQARAWTSHELSFFLIYRRSPSSSFVMLILVLRLRLRLRHPPSAPPSTPSSPSPPPTPPLGPPTSSLRRRILLWFFSLADCASSIIIVLIPIILLFRVDFSLIALVYYYHCDHCALLYRIYSHYFPPCPDPIDSIK